MSRSRVLAGIVVACCCATLLAGWWSKARCLNDGGWEADEQYLGWCYTDVFPLWGGRQLDTGATPYLEADLEYPVLTGAQLFLGQQVALRFPEPVRARVFFHVTAVVNAALSLGVLGVLAAAGLRPTRQLWWALAPALGVYAFLNWDPLAVLLTTAAVLFHLRDRELESGALAGLAVAAKLLPGLLVIPVVVLARLAQGRRDLALRHGGAAVAAWLLVDLPIMVAAPRRWAEFFIFNSERGANFDSLWYVVGQWRGAGFDLSTINRASALLLLAGGALILGVGTRRMAPERWWTLILPLLCWFLVINKVYSPQYTLWVLPLAALVLPRFAPYLGLLLADLFTFLIEFPFLAGQVNPATPAPNFSLFAIAQLIRYGTLLWIAVEATLDTGPPPAGALPAEPAAAPPPRRRTASAAS